MSPESQEAGYFFKHIGDFSPEVLNANSIEYYFISSNAVMTGYAIRDQKKYILDEQEKTENLDTQLPVDGVWIRVCGTTGMVNEHGNKIIELARKNPEVDQWFKEHLGEAIAKKKTELIY